MDQGRNETIRQIEAVKAGSTLQSGASSESATRRIGGERGNSESIRQKSIGCPRPQQTDSEQSRWCSVSRFPGSRFPYLRCFPCISCSSQFSPWKNSAGASSEAWPRPPAVATWGSEKEHCECGGTDSTTIGEGAGAEETLAAGTDHDSQAPIANMILQNLQRDNREEATPYLPLVHF